MALSNSLYLCYKPIIRFPDGVEYVLREAWKWISKCSATITSSRSDRGSSIDNTTSSWNPTFPVTQQGNIRIIRRTDAFVFTLTSKHVVGWRDFAR